ncbi:MAG TPA: glycosyltransferase family 4 protein [Acidimicrobiales bacterium]|nr:glycosyltransferase family 4 protein [Acidimicrobiales bacterium]
MVTKFVPLPDNDGGKQRALAVARRLAQGADVVLCAYDDGDGDLAGLERLGIDVRSVPWRPTAARAARGVLRTRSVSAGRFYSAELVDEVQRAARQAPVDLLQVEYLQMVPLARGVPAARRVLDLHNVESALVRSYARVGRGPAGLLAHAEAAALAAMERALIPTFDTVVVVSERERRRLPAGVGTVLVCPNGRDPDPSGPLAPATTPTAVFVATLGWAPNVDAATWFGDEVWPEVHRRSPEARLLLVGRDPAPSVRALASSSVEVSGTVSDVRPYLAKARVAVAPLRSGGGTRLKILEALDAGRPVVATSVAVDGLEDLIGEGVVVADEPVSMIEAVTTLLEDPDRAVALGRAGHDAVVARHTWDVALAPLLETVVPS